VNFAEALKRVNAIKKAAKKTTARPEALGIRVLHERREDRQL